MNVHHLELFYFVARHGGIMEAVRNIPYGIQQPGEKLYEFIAPFFSGLDKMTEELQGGQARHIRIGASTIIMRDHMAELVHTVKKKFPSLRVSLREGYPAHLESLLLKDEIDLAVTLIEKKAAAGISTKALLELPLVLLVEKGSKFTAAEQLWQRDKIDETLICLPASEALSKSFLAQLDQLNVEWHPGIEASSVDLVETYVANGLGIGVAVAVPKRAPSPKVRALPLPGFPPVVIGAMWRGKTTPLLQAFLGEAQSRGKQLMSGLRSRDGFARCGAQNYFLFLDTRGLRRYTGGANPFRSRGSRAAKVRFLT